MRTLCISELANCSFKLWSKKRVTIASVLVLNPEIIILDEPTAGQDFYHYNEIMSFLIELNRQGKTIIMITHDMHLLSEYSSRTVVLSKGQVVADTTPVLVLNDKKICDIASLRQTSLFEMAEYIGISEPQKLVQLFINHDRKVRTPMNQYNTIGFHREIVVFIN